jgi:CRP/FNR family transcriptional regulator, dissimilatory nitrate respiration regulator
MQTLEVLLARHPMFASLAESEQASLCSLATARRYRKGEFIVQQGDNWPYLFLIGDGKINATKMSIEGRNLIVTGLESGNVFWGLDFFLDDMPMPVSLEAVSASHIYLWERSEILPFLLNHGQLTWELSRLMVRRMALASEVIETLAFQPVAGRLARFLVEISPEDNSPVTRNLTLDEMAARVGSTREVVCRFLQRFANNGLIDITRTEFVINDPEALKALAQQGKG